MELRTIRETHEALRTKQYSCKELVEHCLKTIEALDGTLHAFLRTTPETALASAANVDEKIAKGHSIGLLEGIPFSLKDNMMTKGEITSGGSRILEHYRATHNATVVEKLKDIGAIMVGKNNLDEFAMGSSTENSAFGPSRNPWDTTRVPGGSSGGSAVAVSAGEALFALGSDTGGSIRQPASLSSVVGLKPTYGAVSRYGLLAMASSLDQIGPLTKTVEDAALVFDIIKGPDRHDSSSASAPALPIAHEIKGDIKGLRIGVPKEYFIDGMNSGVAACVNEGIAKLESLGAEIVPVSLPHTQYALSVYYVIMPAEVSANLARLDGIRYGRRAQANNLRDTYLKSREEGLGKETRRRIMLGTYVLAAGYYDAYYKQAQKVRTLVRKDFEDAFKEVDCIVTPTSPVPAFKVGEKASDPLTMYLADIFTVSCNIAGIPGLSVPCGFVQDEGKDLPVGLQILGNHFDEKTILKVGYNYEQATDWHTKNPHVNLW